MSWPNFVLSWKMRCCLTVVTGSCFLASCTHGRGICASFPNAYRPTPIDSDLLTPVASGQEFIVGAATVAACYKEKPFFANFTSLVLVGFFRSKEGKEYIAYSVNGAPHSRIFFEVTGAGELRGSYLTTYPFLRPVP